MIYPVRDWQDWYIAQGYGEKVNENYFHDGADINLRTGGDTDLGQPLLAIAKGTITSVHSHTTIPSFGLHLHFKFESPFGSRWAHYAHLKDIQVLEGQEVQEGQVIATLGKSGTKLAHCHFAIKNRPTGVDGIAKTQEDLTAWEDPLVFIDACNKKVMDDNEIEGLKEMIKTRDNQIAEANIEIEGLKTQVQENERRYNSFLDALWEKLNPITTGEKGEATILGDIERLIGNEDRVRELQKKLDFNNLEAIQFLEEAGRRLESKVVERKAVLEDITGLMRLTSEQSKRILELLEDLEALKKKNNLKDYSFRELLSELLGRLLKNG